MAVLMGEYTHAAVFRLNGIFANPVITVANLDAAVRVEGWALSIGAGAIREGVPAMAPDGPIVAGRRA